VRDTVCVGPAGGEAVCVDMAVLAAMEMEDKPFHDMPSDGIVGLGLQSLTTGPMSSFLGRLFAESRTLLHQFGIALGGDRGELHIGGHDAAHFEGSLQWLPVLRPEDGFWQVAIHAIRVGNVTVDSCRRGCRGVIDTGVSHLGTHPSKVAFLRRALASTPRGSSGLCDGPDLALDLGAVVLTLRPQDYAGHNCTPLVGTVDVDGADAAGLYALGGLVLHRYYAAFDWDQHRLGFAPLAIGRSVAKRSSAIPDTYAGILVI